MTNQAFIAAVFQLPALTGSQKYIDFPFATLAYSETNTTVLWNNALVDKILSETELVTIEEAFKKIHRTPAFYFVYDSTFSALETLLTDNGYKEAFEDVWLVYLKTKVDRTGFENIRKVVTEEDLKLFLETFLACYQKDDPLNHYGDQTDYLATIERSWRLNAVGDAYSCYIKYDGNKPVAVGSLTTTNTFGYLSNIGVIPEARGKGYGKCITRYCLAQSIDSGVPISCLATEKGTHALNFYKRLGFTEQCTAKAYTLQTQ